MSEYLFVEKPFLDHLAALGWEVIGQGCGDPAARVLDHEGAKVTKNAKREAPAFRRPLCMPLFAMDADLHRQGTSQPADTLSAPTLCALRALCLHGASRSSSSKPRCTRDAFAPCRPHRGGVYCSQNKREEVTEMEMTFEQVLEGALLLRPEQKAVLIKTLQVTPNASADPTRAQLIAELEAFARCWRVRTCDQPAQPVPRLGIEVRQRQATAGRHPRDRQRVGG